MLIKWLNKFMEMLRFQIDAIHHRFYYVNLSYEPRHENPTQFLTMETFPRNVSSIIQWLKIYS